MTRINSPRSVDHLVLPVANIDTARRRYQALGFTIAPDGHHPFGTENCCIYFADGTFLEPLGIAQRETCEDYAKKGNAFIVNDQSYRFRRGNDGFSQLAIKSPDAKADRKLFKSAGISGGKTVRFSRQFEDRDGNEGKISFKLAFADDPRSPDTGFFACQVTSGPKLYRSTLQHHAIGAMCLREVLLSEINPTDFQYFFQSFLNQRETQIDSFSLSLDAAGTQVSVMTPSGIEAFFGIECDRRERGMRFEGFVLGVEDLEASGKLLSNNGVKFAQRHGRIIIPPAAGQGTHVILEQA